MQGVLKKFGNEGEEIAASFLERQGFQILERNYRCRLGEIDLIVEKDQKILFVEVKTRHSVQGVSPLELVPYGKQRHISRAAQHYLSSQKGPEKSADFALLIVDCSGKDPVCELIEEAFPLSWGY